MLGAHHDTVFPVSNEAKRRAAGYRSTPSTLENERIRSALTMIIRDLRHSPDDVSIIVVEEVVIALPPFCSWVGNVAL